MSKTIYLAGPITGLTYGESVNWRDYMSNLLTPFGVRTLSPMRGKGYLLSAGVLQASGYDDTILSSAKAIVARDRNDTMKCDLVIMNLLGATRISIGSMIELGWADAARVPVVLVMEPGNVHEHAMVHEMSGFRVSTIGEAVNTALSVLGF